VIKGEDFSPSHTDNSDKVGDEESQFSDKFRCTTATTDRKKYQSLQRKLFINGLYIHW
jgi:hypothetical protein